MSVDHESLSYRVGRVIGVGLKLAFLTAWIIAVYQETGLATTAMLIALALCIWRE